MELYEANQPSGYSMMATSNINHHVISITAYLISAHVNAQLHYHQQSIHEPQTISEPLSSTTDISSPSSRTQYEYIHREV